MCRHCEKDIDTPLTRSPHPSPACVGLGTIAMMSTRTPPHTQLRGFAIYPGAPVGSPARARADTNAVLLIEFDEDRPFSLLGTGEILTDEIEFKNTMSKLTLLTITFPQLRVLWYVERLYSICVLKRGVPGRPGTDGGYVKRPRQVHRDLGMVLAQPL